MKNVKEEMELLLRENILKYWLTFMPDKENGGFYGRICGDETLVPKANKGGILNGRILWTFSAAYRVLGNSEYLAAATRAKDYLLENFYDHEHGGIYWELDYKGNPVDTKKQFYALGFALYGLSEYARATGDKEALDYSIRLFETIEEHSLDKEHNGYREACTRDWKVIEDMRLSDKDQNYPKSQNTHLHIIEPYTNLYRIWKDTRLERALRNLIDIFTDKILNPETHHLDLFFEDNWTRGGGALESYGHDIECSWLLHEAALVLGDPTVLAKVEPIVRKVAKASEKGLLSDGSMVHEANVDTGYVDSDLHWWVQAETVVGFANIYQHFGDVDARIKSLNCWQYIKDHLIDFQHGEWYWSCSKDGVINRKDDKAGFWKCPYHNGRMCLEFIERF